MTIDNAYRQRASATKL